MGATERIIERLVPEWIAHQKRKAQDYNSKKSFDDAGISIPQVFENADVLGVPGQFSEIWRKIWKLKKGMWDQEPLVGEQPREILLDFIGHCFLAIDMIDRQSGGKFGDTGPSPRIIASPEIIEAGRLAVGGDPSELEAFGLILCDDPSVHRDSCRKVDGEEHDFGMNCSFKLRPRRS